ncbi:MAG: hypothetical protein ABI346_02115 [Candidatus Baltobacteraceae bacterium]
MHQVHFAVVATLALGVIGGAPLASSAAPSAEAAATSAPSAPAAAMMLPDCAGKPAARPSEIIFACADANFGVRKLSWTGWGEPFAAATGQAYLNDCMPNCAAGHMHTYPMIVVAKGSQKCPNGERAYETVTYAFVGRSPMPATDDSPPNYTYLCKPRT